MAKFIKRILLTEKEYQKLTKQFSNTAKKTIEKYHYYDTADYELSEKGTICQITEKDNLFVASIKTLSSNKEIEKVQNVYSEKDNSLFYKFNALYQGVLTIQRTLLFVNNDYKVYIDKNEFLETIDYELEIEYYDFNETSIKTPLSLLANALDLDYEDLFLRGNFAKNKSTRFFERKKLLHNSISDSIPKVLSEVLKLRPSSNLNIDNYNIDRYCIVFNESDGSKTGYFFSTPIYNIRTNKIVDNTFINIENGFLVAGSNALITIFNNICMENEIGKCEIILNKKIHQFTKHELKADDDFICATTNGIVYKAELSNKNTFEFELLVSKPFLTVSSNNQSFVLLEDKLVPFLSVSCIGVADKNDNIISPIKLDYQKIDDNKYKIIISSDNTNGQYMLFEINLYEEKLMLSTTVESRSPKKGKVYGGTSFIGSTLEYGEQQLYSKINFPLLDYLLDQRVHKVIMHYPKLSNDKKPLSASSVLSRFCNSDTNWENKSDASGFLGYPIENGEYLDVDITDIFKTYSSIFGDGIIIKPKNSNDGYTVISTGNNYWKPQILEIRYEQLQELKDWREAEVEDEPESSNLWVSERFLI